MNNNGPVNDGLMKLNYHIQNENDLARSGVTGEGLWPSKKDESRIIEDMENENDKQTVIDQVSSEACQQRSQKSRGPLVRWERFMPLRSLKVLLVEYDDSTRQVVSALLWNCGYEVTAVANGLQGWKILEDLTTHIDLVLTEVVMPYMSGISLLSKIMSHKTFKNIPVIMMSSHDSVNIVFKCLSEGAVGFLVKPIRKNELKNLWQHVWRKCQNSSGSGSESGTQTKKYTRLKSAEKSGNNTGNNYEDGIGSIRLNVMDGSENGSDTQSSWTKRVAEADGPQISAEDHLADLPDNTCGQVTLSRPEEFNVNWVPTIAAKEHGMRDFELDTTDMGKDLEIGVPCNPTVQFMHFKGPGERGLAKKADTGKESELNANKGNKQQEKGELELKNGKANGEVKTKGVNIMGDVTTSIFGHHRETVEFCIANGTVKAPDKKDKATNEKIKIPSLELSLKNLRDYRDTKTSTCDKNVLRSSELSAFSRYVSASIADQTSIGNVGSCSSPDNSSEAAKNEMQDFRFNSNSTSPNHLSNVSSNNNDMGSTTNNVFTKQVASGDKAAPKLSVKCQPPSFSFHLGIDDPIPLTQPIAQDKGNASTAKVTLMQAKDINSQVQVEHHHHHYHHHHHVHKMPQHQQLENHEEVSLEIMDAAAVQHGETSMLGAPQEENVYNHSLDGSASGSNHRRNGQDESTAALNARDHGIVKIEGIVVGSGNGSSGQNFFTQREAALNKFRQKRKERCFEKKVRYRSRQKLAEQRPRVRGQFVRQVVHDNKGKDAYC